MYEFIGINDIRASEILDSRGMPTVRAEVLLEDGTTARPAYRPVRRPGNTKQWKSATRTITDFMVRAC